MLLKIITALTCVLIGATAAHSQSTGQSRPFYDAPEVTSEPREFTGIWIIQFERSTFYEGATEIPDWRDYPEGSWLVSNGESGLSKADLAYTRECQTTYAYAITFIGEKRTGRRYMGAYDAKIRVLEMTSIEPIGEAFCEPGAQSEEALEWHLEVAARARARANRP